MSNLSQFFSGGQRVKAAQRGTISLGSGVTSANATISSVNTAKTELHYLGARTGGSAAQQGSIGVRINLAGATTVTATRINSDATTVVSFELLEWE